MEKFKFTIIACFYLIISCQNQSLEEKMVNEATNAFQYHQSDLLLEHIPFKGPIVREKVEKFKINTRVKVFAWYYVHEKDTFWIYTEVAKDFKKETLVSFSPNIYILIENRKNWK